MHYKPVSSINIQIGPSLDVRLKNEIGGLRRTVLRGMVGLGYRFTKNLELNIQYGHSFYNEVKETTKSDYKTSTFILTLTRYFKK